MGVSGVSLDSWGEGVDLEMPWSTAACAHWRAQCSRPCVQYCPDCDDVGPNAPMFLLTVACFVNALPAKDDGMHLCYPLGLETRLPSQVQLALMEGKPHKTAEC